MLFMVVVISMQGVATRCGGCSTSLLVPAGGSWTACFFFFFIYLAVEDLVMLEYAVMFTAVLVCILSVYTCLGDMNDVG